MGTPFSDYYLNMSSDIYNHCLDDVRGKNRVQNLRCVQIIGHGQGAMLLSV